MHTPYIYSVEKDAIQSKPYISIGMDFAFSTKGSMVQADSNGLKMHPKSGR